MADNKILNKILNLFKLGEHQASGGQAGTTEAEMLLAITRARELMAKHNLSMADLAEAKGQTVADSIRDKLREHPVYTRRGSTLHPYDWCVAGAVAKLTETEVFNRRGWIQSANGKMGTTVSVLFVGHEDDVALAGELFHIWLREVRRWTRERYGSQTWTNTHTSYAVGVGTRLLDRASKALPPAADCTPTLALVVASKSTAIAEWKRQHINPQQKPQKSRRTLSRSAFDQGYDDGADFNMNHKKMVR